MYGYKYGFEISYPKKICIHPRNDLNVKESTSEEFLRPPEFVPYQNFEFVKSGSQKRKNTSQIVKKLKLEKLFGKIKKIYFKA